MAKTNQAKKPDAPANGAAQARGPGGQFTNGDADTSASSEGQEPDLSTPGDDAEPKKTPARGRRYRLLDGGEGDYCVYQIMPAGGEIPAGCLMPIPGVPNFEDASKAVRWIKAESGDLLSGKQVMVFKATRIMNINVVSRPKVEITEKPPTLIEKPEKADG